MATTKLNILLVEDEPGVYEFINEILSGEGHTVTWARDGKSGIEAAMDAVFDVAIVDYGIPEPNGLVVLDNLRTIQPSCVRVMASGHLDVQATIVAVNSGEAARILQKPFDGDQLINAIAEAIAMRARVGEQYAWSQAMEQSEEDTHLRECLNSNKLRLEVQPIVIAGKPLTFGYEALLRSDHALFAGPMAVIAAAERHGKLAQLGSVVADRAGELMAQIPEPMRLFVNLHPSELEHPDGLMQRLAPLRKYSSRVVLEITERSRMVNADAWVESTRRLGAAGFNLALDDLGAGYSSLSMLAELKPKFIKIDMSIVRNCDSDHRKRRLLEMLCKFGQATASTVVAEGIETESEGATAAASGARLLQGYYFGRPHRLTAPSP